MVREAGGMVTNLAGGPLAPGVTPEAGGTWVHAERPFGAFERRIQLPEDVDADAITARMDAGVLSLIVPYPERLTPKSIRIGSGERGELETSRA